MIISTQEEYINNNFIAVIALAAAQFVDFDCEPSEDTNSCLTKAYPHLNGTCCMYIQCNGSCHAWEEICDTVPGYDDLYQHFSVDLQRCVVPDATTCSSEI